MGWAGRPPVWTDAYGRAGPWRRARPVAPAGAPVIDPHKQIVTGREQTVMLIRVTVGLRDTRLTLLADLAVT